MEDEKRKLCNVHKFEYNEKGTCPMCDLESRIGDWDDVWSKLKQDPKQCMILVRAGILANNAAMVNMCAMYAFLDEGNADGYKEEMKIEAGDVIAQIKILCKFMGWKFEELESFSKTKIRTSNRGILSQISHFKKKA